jgi:SRF-type transcription factor (DNA-binding and dimerisation domain)
LLQLSLSISLFKIRNLDVVPDQYRHKPHTCMFGSIIFVCVNYIMKLRKIKTTIKRRSESTRVKRQQQDRRKESLFKKACEYSAKCDAEVYLYVKIKRNSQIFFFNSKNSREWLLLDEQMIGHPFSRPCKG